MRIKKLLEIVENNSGVKSIINKGYFLGSIFAMLEDIKPVEEWRFLFYNPQSKKIFEFFYHDGFVEKGESEKRQREIQKLDTSDVRIEFDDALSTAKERFDEKVCSKIISYLISLHAKKIDKKTTTVWTINIIYSGMNVQSYDIDAQTGEIVTEESTSLISVR